MDAAASQNRRTADRPLESPRTGGSVWPRQSCPAFSPRSMALAAERQCWFCSFADFHLTQEVALDVGICCWPKVCIE